MFLSDRTCAGLARLPCGDCQILGCGASAHECSGGGQGSSLLLWEQRKGAGVPRWLGPEVEPVAIEAFPACAERCYEFSDGGPLQDFASRYDLRTSDVHPHAGWI